MVIHRIVARMHGALLPDMIAKRESVDRAYVYSASKPLT